MGNLCVLLLLSPLLKLYLSQQSRVVVEAILQCVCACVCVCAYVCVRVCVSSLGKFKFEQLITEEPIWVYGLLGDWRGYGPPT